ncbi:hypothetical protein [Adhaeribacter terreus]|uniref:Uncharacterized protein n=1 Tax=Adhaeribacter terreus TaxID=529703 RepID=A0ABW0EAS8_9BACT
MERLKKIAVVLAAFFLTLLLSEEIFLMAQGIRNQRARMDVRGTSRRTARRVNRRHDYYQGGRGYYGGAYVAPAAVAVGAAATAAVLYSLPGGCVDYSGYYNCNGTYYQPQMQGTEVVYIQVEVDD